MLYTADGREITKVEIQQAVAQGRAVICWSHGNWYNTATLLICETPKDAQMGAERDTRGECYSMSDEVWCEMASTVGQATRAAAGLLKVG